MDARDSLGHRGNRATIQGPFWPVAVGGGPGIDLFLISPKGTGRDGRTSESHHGGTGQGIEPATLHENRRLLSPARE
jgi:hypothetical protein